MILINDNDYETKHTHTRKNEKKLSLQQKQVRKYEYISLILLCIFLTTVIVIHSVMIIIMAFFYAYFRSFIFMVFGKLQKALAGTFQNLFSPGKTPQIQLISRISQNRRTYNVGFISDNREVNIFSMFF